MFYPINSLKRGGRFYMCWVADSWPMRFQEINRRQLWSQDICKLCDDILEVVTIESGRPTKRFSLRLSSQLMRGLVRLYYRKATETLNELGALNARVFKNVNKKLYPTETGRRIDPKRNNIHAKLHQLPEFPQILQEQHEIEQTVEEMIQGSDNVVANIQEITLRESTVPQQLVPDIDGFGEEHPDQAMHLMADRTLEVMLHSDLRAIQHSGLEVPFDVTAKSQDSSRPIRELQMERISAHDATMFGKEISGTPDVPLPVLPIPQMTKLVTGDHKLAPATVKPATAAELQPSLEIELEEIDETDIQPKRRRLKNRLMIDKRTKIPADIFRDRINDTTVELRCQDSSDDIIKIRLPYKLYFRRPCHAGRKITSSINLTLNRLFQRNLGTVNKKTLADRDIEVAMARSQRSDHDKSLAEKIQEVDEQIYEISTGLQKAHLDVAVPEADISKEVFLNGTELRKSVPPADRIDISDLVTQLVGISSQPTSPNKRVCESENPNIKRKKTAGYVSFEHSQRETMRHVKTSIRAILQDAGIAEIETYAEPPLSETEKFGIQEKGSFETPLGSIDRTKVSLGSSEKTTDSQRFIREHWGTEGIIIQILDSIKSGKTPVTVESLVERGPVLPGYKKMTAAKCFASLLKLKRHRFIQIIKRADSLEIASITLSSKFNEFLLR